MFLDNSKLRASIFTKLGLSAIQPARTLCLHVWGLWRGEIFGSALLQPARNVCVSLNVFLLLWRLLVGPSLPYNVILNNERQNTLHPPTLSTPLLTCVTL